MTLREITKAVQRALPGVEVDGIAGMQTMLAILNALNAANGSPEKKIPDEQLVHGDGAPTALNARTLRTIGTLDSKCRDQFLQFAQLAEITAATFGCDYIAISGTRSMDEQAELRRKYLAGGPLAGRPGYSWHNFGVAADFGVFLNGGKIYLDGGTAAQAALAQRVHAACSIHARECGLVWGGTWKGKSCDPPHYQVDMGHSTPTAADRSIYKIEGSVL